jgi:type VI secretion system protein ImpK
MSDNPFAEPEDDNRTVIRPTPGRRRTPAAEQPAVAPSEQPSSDTQMPAQRPAVAAEGTEDMAVGGDVLAVAAAPLLQLIARLRKTASPPDSGFRAGGA